MNDPITIQMPDGGVLYHCNPALAADCKKTNCFLFGGPCSMTPRKEWACVTFGDLIRRKNNSQLAEYLSWTAACPPGLSPKPCHENYLTCTECWRRYVNSPAGEVDL